MSEPYTLTLTLVRKDAHRNAYGWASIIAQDGRPVVDLQGDVITAEELEGANVRYMLKRRDGGEMHARTGVATCIASLVTTPEIVKALFPDVTPGQIPVGWLVGFHVHDDALWKRITDGELGALSIHGLAERHAIEAAA